MLWRSKKLHTAVRLPAIPCLCIAETTSSSVKSGCSSISVSSQGVCTSNGDVLPPRGLAASRREAPPSTRAITRMRMSAEYAFGMARPPDESMPPDSPIYRSLGILRFYSARTCSRSARVASIIGARTARFRRAYAVGIELRECSTFASFRWAAPNLYNDDDDDDGTYDVLRRCRLVSLILPKVVGIRSGH